MSSFKKIKKASKYADCKNSGKGSLLKYYGVKTERRVLKLKDGYLSLECEGFTHFGIWSVPGAPFVCLEPWMGRCDDHGFAGEISEKPGILKVEPSGTFQKSYRIKVFTPQSD